MRVHAGTMGWHAGNDGVRNDVIPTTGPMGAQGPPGPIGPPGGMGVFNRTTVQVTREILLANFPLHQPFVLEAGECVLGMEHIQDIAMVKVYIGRYVPITKPPGRDERFEG